MTTKTIKTTILMLLALSIGTVGILTNGNSFADSEKTTQGVYKVTPTEGLGKDILKYGQPKVVYPEATELFAIADELNDSEKSFTDAERKQMSDRIDYLQDQLYAKVSPLSDEKNSQLESHREIFNSYLTEKMTNKIALGEFRDSLPFIRLGIDRDEQALKFGFLEENLTDTNVKNYFKQIRAIIGNDVNIVIFSSVQPKTGACASQTSDCSPIVGGIKIEVANSEACSLGFQAKRLVGVTYETGFITAGHCSDGSASPSLNVEQATSPDVGTLLIEKYQANSNCDCAWVKALAGISVGDTIYSGISPSEVGTVTVNSAVTGKGYASTSQSGLVTDSSEDFWTEDDGDEGAVFLRSHFVVDFEMGLGDSGGPVYRTSDSDLFGTMSSFGGGQTWYSNANNIGTVSSSVSWDFT